VDLIIIDTSRAYYEGDDENDNVQMGEHARRLRSLKGVEGGPTVVVLCHPPKNCPEDQLQPVGGGAFVAEMDGNLTCTGDGDIATVHWYRKIRGPDFMPLKFGLKKDVKADQLHDSKGRPIMTVVAEPLNERKFNQRMAQTEEREEAVVKFLEANPGAPVATIARGIGMVGEAGPDNAGVHRILRRLKKRGRVQQRGGHYQVRNRGEKE
jgi:hypothetical protein